MAYYAGSLDRRPSARSVHSSYVLLEVHVHLISLAVRVLLECKGHVNHYCYLTVTTYGYNGNGPDCYPTSLHVEST